ncbi:MAG TPA: hypothetical protein VFE82_19435 [Ramlibacter sp.]|uniref:hypothetical protein n=1 Tax=Ramlibacter sp. TaxID=1917967 RepID=UPI002D6CEC87|nr:hypothetical protein [Ramlibacter sp.]HZY20653.1 hypothetical protein [Ramlibacter sp.]
MLAVGGGALAWIEPGWRAGRFTAAGQLVIDRLARAFLDGSLPDEPQRQAIALEGAVERTQALVQALPTHAQDELSRLLALLATPLGRRVVAGLEPEWQRADVRALQRALQSMRTSRLPLRRQVYQALHDMIGASYFSGDDAWPLLGYPGPTPV